MPGRGRRSAEDGAKLAETNGQPWTKSDKLAGKNVRVRIRVRCARSLLQDSSRRDAVLWQRTFFALGRLPRLEPGVIRYVCRILTAQFASGHPSKIRPPRFRSSRAFVSSDNNFDSVFGDNETHSLVMKISHFPSITVSILPQLRRNVNTPVPSAISLFVFVLGLAVASGLPVDFSDAGGTLLGRCIHQLVYEPHRASDR